MKRRSVPGDPTERGRRSRSEAVKTATTPRDSTASTVSISVIFPWGRSERTTLYPQGAGSGEVPHEPAASLDQPRVLDTLYGRSDYGTLHTASSRPRNH